MSQQLRNILKVYFTTGAKPTQAQFENLIDSLFSLLDDNKSAITGLERAINIRGAGDLYNASFRGGMIDRLKGDAWIMSGVASPVEGDTALLKAGDIIVAWKDDAAMANFAIDTEWYILRIGTLQHECATIDDVYINDIDEYVLPEFSNNSEKKLRPSGKTINDSTSPSTSVLWTSNRINAFYGDGTVTFGRLHTSLKDIGSVISSNIDWDTAAIFEISIFGTTTLTFSNLNLNKVITLIIDGNFTINLPTYCKRISGTYNGAVSNYIQFHCVNDTGGNESVWYTINQEL
jgi:hypothetical protein